MAIKKREVKEINKTKDVAPTPAPAKGKLSIY
jgi:hypothetical protein